MNELQTLVNNTKEYNRISECFDTALKEITDSLKRFEAEANVNDNVLTVNKFKISIDRHSMITDKELFGLGLPKQELVYALKEEITKFLGTIKF